jgi:hypothetical protein
MSTETRGFPPGEMRASDADRDLALAELSEHFQTGRLTQEEFDERSGRALQARTGRELSELFADLPGSGGAAGPAGPWGSPDPSPSDPSGQGSPWQGPSWPGPASRSGRGPLDRSPGGRRPVPFVIVGVVAAIAVTSLLGHVAHVTIGPVGTGFGWVIPVFIVLVVLRRLARRR